MAPDDTRAEDVTAWLRKAALDLRAARHEAAQPQLDLWFDVAFHAQQAVEKSWKALLCACDVPYRKTHSLEELGRLCSDLVPGLARLVDAASPLTEYAWRFRYPSDAGDATREEAELAMTTAEQVYHAVCTRLGQPEIE